MTLEFDHAICAVKTLEQGVQAYRDLGFVVADGGTHATGTHNAVVPLEVGYLELLSVYDESLARRTQRHGAICDYLSARSGGLIGYALRSDDIDADAERLAGSGLSFEGPQDAHRTQPDGQVLRWRVLRPAPQPAPAVLPMIVWGDQSAPPMVDHPNTVRRAAAISIAGQSLDGLCDLYATYLGVEAGERTERDDLGACEATVALDGFAVRLLAPAGDGPLREAIDADGEGPIALDLAATDGGAIGVAGGMVDAMGTKLQVVGDRPVA